MEIAPEPKLEIRTKKVWKPSLSQTGYPSEVVQSAAVVVIEHQQQFDMCSLKIPLAGGKAVVLVLVLISTLINGPEQTRSMLHGLKTSLDLLEAMYTNGLQQIPFVRLE
jgi:hypothetical protein